MRFPPGLLEQDERAGDLELDVVRMRGDGDGSWHGERPLPTTSARRCEDLSAWHLVVGAATEPLAKPDGMSGQPEGMFAPGMNVVLFAVVGAGRMRMSTSV